ncbi:MAG: hypothetical protein H5T73_01265 [Actinobacteria bacterium]|nr:hypothetical protein [Actinomycetota bacterium]
MSQGNWIVFVHFIAIWLSVITSLVAGWSLSIHNYVSFPVGCMVWLLGLLINLRQLRDFRMSPTTRRRQYSQISHQRIAARTIMNVGIALAFRSWFTLLVAGLLIPMYISAARKRRAYLDYLRTGMLSDAFPHRVKRH